MGSARDSLWLCNKRPYDLISMIFPDEISMSVESVCFCFDHFCHLTFRFWNFEPKFVSCQRYWVRPTITMLSQRLPRRLIQTCSLCPPLQRSVSVKKFSAKKVPELEIGPDLNRTILTKLIAKSRIVDGVQLPKVNEDVVHEVVRNLFFRTKYTPPRNSPELCVYISFTLGLT